jgi:hypothetical protein
VRRDYLEDGDYRAQQASAKALDRASDNEGREVRCDHLDSGWMMQFQR